MNRLHKPLETDSGINVQRGDAAHAAWYLSLFGRFVRLMLRLFFRVRIIGLANVPSSPAIICANHLGWTDAFLPLAFFPSEPRVYILGEREVAHISGFRNGMIRRLQIMVALDRNKPIEAMRIMESVLQRGGSLLIFPEGELGREEGRIGPLQHGAAHLSITVGVPLVPLGLTGTSELWLRRTLTMRAGTPIYPTEFEGSTRTRTHNMTAQLESGLTALLPGDFERPRFKPLKKWLTGLF